MKSKVGRQRTVIVKSKGEIEMRNKLNAQITFSSVIQIVLLAFVLIFLSAVVAKASCGNSQALGCDINCTPQIVNDCESHAGVLIFVADVSKEPLVAAD
jgi:hypothetical protein